MSITMSTKGEQQEKGEEEGGNEGFLLLNIDGDIDTLLYIQ